ncbi:MAG TPA: serine/threonine-protein kinase [Segeticoccus sp.]|nr:serine/threonine-protein kinase [Segeticoccus sp.]
MATGTGPDSQRHGGERRVRSTVEGAQEHTRLGPYRLLQRLGEGGMGVVHLALDPEGRAVAIKVLRPHIAHDQRARDRLAREVDTLSRVRSPRVAAVLDADVDGDRPYVVTEYVPGPPLDKVVDDEGPLDGERLLRLGRGLVEALDAIHGAGVVHRDLKPGNVLLVDDDPVVIDFGIAHVADDVRLTMTGMVMGTPGYLSPEVVEGAPVTEATDWWGWAATLSFAASGTPPFGRGPMPAVLDRVTRGQADVSAVDPRLAPLLATALSPVPRHRPDADEIVEALEEYAEGGDVTTVLPQAAELEDDEAYAGSTPRAGASPTQRVEQDHTAVMPVPPGARPPARFEDDHYDDYDEFDDRVGGDADDRGAYPRAEPPVGWDPERPTTDPRIGRAYRSGTLAALLAGTVALSAIWPLVTWMLLLVWSLVARFADRSVTSMVMRRHSRGFRRSDVPVAVASSPWHLVVAVVGTLLALIIPLVVAAACDISTALGLAALDGVQPQPLRAVPVAVGTLVGVLLLWWGPGGAAFRRGSRSIVRGALPRGLLTQLVVGVVLAAAAALAVWAWSRHGVVELWPWPSDRVPLPDSVTGLR